MSLLTVLKHKWRYSVETPGVGRLLYLEGNREYTFPVFEEDGVLVLVDTPSHLRVRLFFNWQKHRIEFPREERERIVPRLEEYLESHGMPVRIFNAGEQSGREFEFHPELHEQRNRAMELLEKAGLNWFSEYASIDLIHDEYGLEVGGVRSEQDADKIWRVLRRAFPHWHHVRACYHEGGREQGWTISIHMLSAQNCSTDLFDEN